MTTTSMTSPADRTRLHTVCSLWSPLWNGDLALADEILADDFRIWFGALGAAAGDEIVGPAAFAAFVGRHRATNETFRYAPHGAFTIDVEAQQAAMAWTVSFAQDGRPDGAPVELAGVDQLAFRDGRISRVWSATGERPVTL